MRKNIILWILAFLITLLTAYFQRATGPTYPIQGDFNIEQQKYHFKLYTSHGGKNDLKVFQRIPNELCRGYLFYKRYKTDDEFSKVALRREKDTLFAFLPHQPPAAKLEYSFHLKTAHFRPHNQKCLINFIYFAKLFCVNFYKCIK